MQNSSISGSASGNIIPRTLSIGSKIAASRDSMKAVQAIKPLVGRKKTCPHITARELDDFATPMSHEGQSPDCANSFGQYAASQGITCTIDIKIPGSRQETARHQQETEAEDDGPATWGERMPDPQIRRALEDSHEQIHPGTERDSVPTMVRNANDTRPQLRDLVANLTPPSGQRHLDPLARSPCPMLTRHGRAATKDGCYMSWGAER